MARTIALWLVGVCAMTAPAMAQDTEEGEEAEKASEDEKTPSMATEAAKEEGKDDSAEEASGMGTTNEEAPAKPVEKSTLKSAGAPKPTTMLSAPMSLPPPPPAEDELPIPTLTIDRIPPQTSYEFAIQVSYGQVSYFRDEVPPWVGFGLRTAYGKNFGLHRVGVQGGFSSEGDMGVHTLLVAEPSVAYDVVTPFGLQLGVSAGPAFMYWSDASTQINERDFGIGPSAAARVGWSQTWTRIGRRLFVFAEPKLRVAGGSPDVTVAIAVGSGAGR